MSSFSQLLIDLENTNQFPIDVEFIVDWLMQNGYQEEITFTPVQFDEKKVIAYLKRYRDMSPSYQEGNRVAASRYSNKLNTCWRRFVCTKELMHFFDTPEEQVKNKETLSDFLLDISNSSVENKPSTLTVQADFNAITKALLCLAPLHAVESLRDARKNGVKTDLEIAETLRIPKEMIRRVFFDSHARAYIESKNEMTLQVVQCD